MNILIDAGNTCLKWMLCERYQVIDSQPIERLCYDNHTVEDRLYHLLVQNKPDRLIIVHVLGQSFSLFVNNTCQRLAIKLTLVDTQAHNKGIKIGYSEPSRLGTDRLVAMVGAHFLYNKKNKGYNKVLEALIIIDCGTAVTIDFLLLPNQHLGGIILPGYRLWQHSLMNATKQIKRTKITEVTPSIFATQTQEAIVQGANIGLPSAILGVVDAMLSAANISNNHAFQLVVTGGDSALLEDRLNYPITVVPNLIFIGLQVIAKR